MIYSHLRAENRPHKVCNASRDSLPMRVSSYTYVTHRTKTAVPSPIMVMSTSHLKMAALPILVFFNQV